MSDLNAVITESLDEEAAEPVEVQDPTTGEVEEAEVPSIITQPAVETPEPVPAAGTPPVPITPEAVDEFEKKFGVPALGMGGRENRIPYSRVKKITEKAVTDAKKSWETESSPRMQELETQNKDYSEKLGYYTRFEQTMMQDPDQFLTMLSSIPAYGQFFKNIESAFSFIQQYQQQYGQIPGVGGNGHAPAVDDMPQPDQALGDGSMVYSLDGLKKLMQWQSDQTENRVTQKFEERYKPIESEWQANQRIQQIIPHVRAQIDDARTWPLFNENEGEIVKVLQQDQRISLEAAYRKVVFPKIVSDRNKIRDEVLKEVRSAPRSTSVSAGSVRADAPTSTGPRSLEDIIAEQIKTLK